MAVHGRYSPQEELPDIPVIRDAVLARCGHAVRYVEVPVPGDWEIACNLGYPLWQAHTPEHRRLLRQTRRAFIASLEAAARDLGAVGMMIGLAAHESRGRRINAALRGTHYAAAGRMPTLAPLQWLTHDDVIAYYAVHDLPWLRIYEVADDPRRVRSELSMAAGIDHDGRRYQVIDAIDAAYPGHLKPWRERWREFL